AEVARVRSELVHAENAGTFACHERRHAGTASDALRMSMAEDSGVGWAGGGGRGRERAVEDRYGLPLTSTSPRAVEAYRAGVDRILLAAHGADRAFEEGLSGDPGFGLDRIVPAPTPQV